MTSYLRYLTEANEELTGILESHYVNVLIHKKTLPLLLRNLDRILKDVNDDPDLIRWFRTFFRNVEVGRKKIFDSCEKSNMCPIEKRQELFDLFEEKSISETSSVQELDSFVQCLERYMNETPVLLLGKKFQARDVDTAVQYVGPENFNFLWRKGFFDNFPNSSKFKQYVHNAKKLYRDTEFYGYNRALTATLELLQAKLCPQLQKRIGILKIKNYNPWVMLRKLKDAVNTLNELNAAQTHLFSFYDAEKEPEKFKNWARLVIKTNRDVFFLNSQPPEYFEALNEHMDLVFAFHGYEIYDKKSTLLFCQYLESTLNVEETKDEVIRQFNEEWPDPQERIWKSMKLRNELIEESGFCKVCALLSEFYEDHEKENCPLKEFPDYDNFWQNLKEDKLRGIMVQRMKEVAEHREKMKELPQRKPYGLDFEKMVGDYFGRRRT